MSNEDTPPVGANSSAVLNRHNISANAPTRSKRKKDATMEEGQRGNDDDMRGGNEDKDLTAESRATKRLKSTDKQLTTERRDPAVTHEGFSIENQPRVPAQHSSLATALRGLRPDAPLPYPPVLRKADHTKATVEPIQTTAKVCIFQSFGWFVACVLAS
jgi:hypothetical protein